MNSLDRYRELNSGLIARCTTAADHWTFEQRQFFARVMAWYGHDAEYNALTRQWTIDGVKMYGAVEVDAAYQTAKERFYAAEHGLHQFAEELAAL